MNKKVIGWTEETVKRWKKVPKYGTPEVKENIQKLKDSFSKDKK